MTMGHCPHGEFNLEEGCPECIAERQAQDQVKEIVKVQLNSFARTNKGQRAIPGVEFFNERIVTVRGKEG